MKYYKIQNRSQKNSHSCVPLTVQHIKPVSLGNTQTNCLKVSTNPEIKGQEHEISSSFVGIFVVKPLRTCMLASTVDGWQLFRKK
jgi:hypothetical protein